MKGAGVSQAARFFKNNGLYAGGFPAANRAGTSES
jgi:hypothetical protein